MTFEEWYKQFKAVQDHMAKQVAEMVAEYEATRCKCVITNDICPCHGKRAKKERDHA